MAVPDMWIKLLKVGNILQSANIYFTVSDLTLKRECHEIFDLCFFHQTSNLL
jgi:hypothetical protein